MADRKGVALVVGAGDYIGKAVAERFARGGFAVGMTRRPRNLDKQREAAAEIAAATGARVEAYGSDARDEAATAQLFDQVEGDLGPLDLVVFNVGGNVRFPLLETTERVYRKVWEMCAFAGFLTGREAARRMLPRERGAIFFTGATSSVMGRQGYAAFAAGKFALRGTAQALARELGPKGIHVAHLIVDAGVDTAFVQQRIRDAGGDPDKLPPDTLMKPASIAEAYWGLYHQQRDGWTHELDIRPFAETW